MYRNDYVSSLANIVREHIDFDRNITFSNIKYFVEEIGGHVSIITTDYIYPANIEKLDSTFVLKVVNDLNDYSKVLYSLIEIGHLFLHCKYLDEKYYNSLHIEDTAYFRYGRGIERSEACKFAYIVYNGLN